MWMDQVDALVSAIQTIHQYLRTKGRPPLTRRQTARACRLLGVHGQDGRWTLNAREARRRVVVAGLDPETLEVADEVRWAHAVDYMRATETFRLEGFKQWLLDHDEPSAVPAIDVPARPHPRARKKNVESAVDAAINQRIKVE